MMFMILMLYRCLTKHIDFLLMQILQKKTLKKNDGNRIHIPLSSLEVGLWDYPIFLLKVQVLQGEILSAKI